jgi:Mn2+/Fe2+ NRAMP family transporter
MPYQRYVRWLKWLTLSLLAYVAVAFSVAVDWPEVLRGVLVPRLPAAPQLNSFILLIVAVFGTTISPYLFFWQAALEMEDTAEQRARTGAEVKRHLRRIKLDTIVGMTFSNAIAFFIVLSTAATLHAAGVTTIESSAQAAEALRPIAGDFAFALFGLGIIGTGMLAIPVLAGSAAYAVAEAFRWPGSLTLDLRRSKHEGIGFYGVIAAATLGGTVICLAPLDPMRALIGAAVANGVIAVPIMAVMMLLATSRKTMGAHVIGPRLAWLGWMATSVMALVVVALLITL